MIRLRRDGWWNVIVIGALLFAGCGQAEYFGIKPAVSYAIKGDVKDNYYVSPNKSFRVQMPALIKPGAKVRDDQFQDGIWHVSMTDDLCREYIVLENPFGTRDTSVEAWIDRKIMPMFKDSKYTLIERKYVQTKYGQGVMLRWTEKEAAPCAQITFKDGKQVAEKPDAEVGFYLIKIDNYAYRFIYVNGFGMGEEFMGFKRGPTEEVLTTFINGFEVIRASETNKQ
jgi:hypothetical protein